MFSRYYRQPLNSRNCHLWAVLKRWTKAHNFTYSAVVKVRGVTAVRVISDPVSLLFLVWAFHGKPVLLFDAWLYVFDWKGQLWWGMTCWGRSCLWFFLSVVIHDLLRVKISRIDFNQWFLFHDGIDSPRRALQLIAFHCVVALSGLLEELSDQNIGQFEGLHKFTSKEHCLVVEALYSDIILWFYSNWLTSHFGSYFNKLSPSVFTFSRDLRRYPIQISGAPRPVKSHDVNKWHPID